MENENFVYRFRSVEKILDGFQELEKQELYFSEPSELNDPAEGLKNIFWSGDAIVWKNLLKHYLLCIERSCLLAYIGNDYELYSQNLPKMVFLTENDLPTGESKKLFAEIFEAFFKNNIIRKYPDILSQKAAKIYRAELICYLSSMYHYAVCCINDVYSKHGLINKLSFSDEIIEPVVGTTPGIARLVSNIALDHVRWISCLGSQPSQRYIPDKFEFAEKYVDALERLLFGPHYVVSFSNRYDNSSLWGHYGDGHKGVCLVFNKEVDAAGQNEYIELEFENEKAGRQGFFEPVNYTEKYETTDFFRSMGAQSTEKVVMWWLTDDEKASDCMDVYREEEKFRQEYWERSGRLNRTKSKDWEYEQESRLILMDSFNSGHYSDKLSRKAKYKFNSLHGIIFGIKTSMNDKLKIYEAINRKCSVCNRKDFVFYQACYSEDTGRINKYKLMIQ